MAVVRPALLPLVIVDLCMSVAIVKYNAGNVFSVKCALQRIGVEAVITDDFEALRRADKVVFPGVGEASTAMHFLREKGLDEVIKSLTQPVLGICIGLIGLYWIP